VQAAALSSGGCLAFASLPPDLLSNNVLELVEPRDFAALIVQGRCVATHKRPWLQRCQTHYGLLLFTMACKWAKD